MAEREIVLVSNRGPLNFAYDDRGVLAAHRASGGLVSGLTPLIADSGAIWMAAAMSDADRAAATGGVLEAGQLRVRLVDIPEHEYRTAYDDICNSTLWYVHHDLYDLVRNPSFDDSWYAAWECFRRYTSRFADAVIEHAPPNAVVLSQDYHLGLLAPPVREARPDLRLVHFSHTPFAGPDLMAVLPEHARREYLEAMAANHVCGFHTDRWRRRFLASTRESLAREPYTFVAPLGPDAADLEAVSKSDACAEASRDLAAQVGSRQFIARVDRLELSKNLVRGFRSYERLLEERPELLGEVVFGAYVYPSRERVEDYNRYRFEVESIVHDINKRWGTTDWTPIVLDVTDDFARSVAAMKRYDVLLVNPIRDGLNQVAKEGALLNERDGAVVLSTEAGAWEEFAGVALGVNPYDEVATADALRTALSFPPAERARRAETLRSLAIQRGPAEWLADQLAAGSS